MAVKDLRGTCPRQENNGLPAIDLANGNYLVAGYGIPGVCPRKRNREDAGKEAQRQGIDG